HVRRKVQAAVLATLVQSADNLVQTLHLHHLTRLKGEGLTGRRLTLAARIDAHDLLLDLPAHPGRQHPHHLPEAVIAVRYTLPANAQAVPSGKMKRRLHNLT